MFEKLAGFGNQPEQPRSMAGSLISDDLVVEGLIASKGAVEIRGRLNGNAEADALLIASAARVTGDVRGNRIGVAGSVHGNISGGEVTLAPSAQVHGGISYKELTIETGATVNGELRRG